MTSAAFVSGSGAALIPLEKYTKLVEIYCTTHNQKTIISHSTSIHPDRIVVHSSNECPIKKKVDIAYISSLNYVGHRHPESIAVDIAISGIADTIIMDIGKEYDRIICEKNHNLGYEILKKSLRDYGYKIWHIVYRADLLSAVSGKYFFVVASKKDVVLNQCSFSAIPSISIDTCDTGKPIRGTVDSNDVSFVFNRTQDFFANKILDGFVDKAKMHKASDNLYYVFTEIKTGDYLSVKQEKPIVSRDDDKRSKVVFFHFGNHDEYFCNFLKQKACVSECICKTSKGVLNGISQRPMKIDELISAHGGVVGKFKFYDGIRNDEIIKAVSDGTPAGVIECVIRNIRSENAKLVL